MRRGRKDVLPECNKPPKRGEKKKLGRFVIMAQNIFVCSLQCLVRITQGLHRLCEFDSKLSGRPCCEKQAKCGDNTGKLPEKRVHASPH